MRKRIRRAFCALRNGHPFDCTIFANFARNEQRHVHFCERCNTVLLDETTAITNGTLNLVDLLLPLPEMGMSVEDQQQTWIH